MIPLLPYCTICICLLYIIYKLFKYRDWCNHNFKAIKGALYGQMMLNDINNKQIQTINAKIDELIKQKGRKHAKRNI